MKTTLIIYLDSRVKASALIQMSSRSTLLKLEVLWAESIYGASQISAKIEIAEKISGPWADHRSTCLGLGFPRSQNSHRSPPLTLGLRSAIMYSPMSRT